MKINKKIAFSGLAIIAVILVFFALQTTHTTHFFKSAADKHSQQDVQYQQDKKSAIVAGNGNPATTDAQGNVIASTGTYTTPDTSDQITISPNQQGSQVVITTKLKGYSDGNCLLSITNGPKNTSQTAQIIYAPNFSTCAGFSVPISALADGTWSISLAVTSGGVTTNQSTTYVVQ